MKVQTIILPGGSVKNKDWLDECAKSLQVEGLIRSVSWDHWADPEQRFDPKEKAMLIARHTRGETINIVAKSIGSLVAAYVIEAIPAQINKVLICGLPLHDISDSEKSTIKKALAGLSKTKLLCFQNSNDPHGSYLEAKTFMAGVTNVVSKDRNDHHYPFYKEFSAFLVA